MADKNIGAFALGSVMPGTTHVVAVQAVPNNSNNVDPVLIPVEDVGGVGPSAYDVAVDNGYSGTEEDWLATLVGPQGIQGVVGPAGPMGVGLQPNEYGNLTDTKIAEIELADVEWVFVVNPDGDDRSNQAIPAQLAGDMERHVIRWDPGMGFWQDFGFFTGIEGPVGPQGNQGDPGPQGPAGNGAYTDWLADGNVGTITQFLATLKGEDGDAGTVVIDDTVTGAPGSGATVQNFGTAQHAVLKFTIPRGNPGVAGPQGAPGPTVVPNQYGALSDGVVSAIQANGVNWNFLVISGGDLRSNQATPAGISGDMSGHLVRYEPAGNAWFDLGPIVGVAGPMGPQGPEGDPGAAGAAGLSAYQTAVNNGFSGTEVQWLASLVGAPGSQGADGEVVPTFDVMIGHPDGIALGGYPITLDAAITCTVLRLAHKASGTTDWTLVVDGVSVATGSSTTTKDVMVVDIDVTQGDEITLMISDANATFMGMTLSVGA